MLREIQPVRQHPGEPPRRWFNSADFDLILWLPALTAPACEAVAFQLCYDKRHTEHALHWQAPGTCKHFQVEDGEQGNRSSSHKSAPLLQTAKPLNASSLLTAFLGESHGLPPDVSEFVQQQLRRLIGT